MKVQAVYFEDMNSKRLKLFVETVKDFKKSYQMLLNLFSEMKEIKSRRLKQLINNQLPNIENEIKMFDNVIKESQGLKDKQKVVYEPIFDDPHLEQIQQIK